jgi:hypothetical protein
MKKQNNLEEALTGLLEKYEVKPVSTFRLDKNTKSGDVVLLPGYDFSAVITEENEIPLRVHRERQDNLFERCYH